MKINKLFVVRKYVVAKSAKDAIRQEKDCEVDDVWIDEDYKKGSITIEGFKHKK